MFTAKFLFLLQNPSISTFFQVLAPLKQNLIYLKIPNRRHYSALRPGHVVSRCLGSGHRKNILSTPFVFFLFNVLKIRPHKGLKGASFGWEGGHKGGTPIDIFEHPPPPSLLTIWEEIAFKYFKNLQHLPKINCPTRLRSYFMGLSKKYVPQAT